MRSVLLMAVCFPLLAGVSPRAMAQPARPPARGGQDPCLVWWQAPEHLGEVVTFCGSPETATEQDGFLVLQLGSTAQDLRVGLPLELRGGCSETLDRLVQDPASLRVRATGELRRTGEGPFLVVSTCDQLSVEWQTF